MFLPLDEFKRKKDFLICIDSDGCAMNTMDIKHFRCFGPCLIEEWRLDQWDDLILNRWNEINLYTMTRGINRFLGLAMILKEVSQNLCPIDGIEEFEAWTRQTAELSNSSLKDFVSTAKSPCPAKALSWSNKVNASVEALNGKDKAPFDGVFEGLKTAHEIADIAVVSSANREAVQEEWERCHLLEYVDVLCCQDAGSKSHCIKALKNFGYDSSHILMVGDAPGDADAAAQNNIYYYPILVKHETDSWNEFRTTALNKFKTGNYEYYGKEMLQKFLENLSWDTANKIS